MSEKRIYSTRLDFTKISPPQNFGVIPRIGRAKLLEKLAKDGITEEELENSKTKTGYAVFLPGDLLLTITEKGV